MYMCQCPVVNVIIVYYTRVLKTMGKKSPTALILGLGTQLTCEEQVTPFGSPVCLSTPSVGRHRPEPELAFLKPRS